MKNISAKEEMIDRSIGKIEDVRKKIQILKNTALKKEEFINFSYLLNSLVKKEGLSASELSFTEDKSGGGFIIRGFQFTVSGEYKNLRRFLYSLEKRFPYMVIDDVFQKEQSGIVTSLKLGGVIIII